MLLSFRLLAALVLAASGILLGHARAERTMAETRIIPLTIQEGSTTIETTIASREDPITVGDALAAFHISEDGAVILPAPDTPLTPGMTITLLTERRVEIIDSTKTLPAVVTHATTVAGALAENGISLGPLDRISPASFAPVEENGKIRVTRITEENRTEIVTIPFPIVLEEDPDLSYGQERVLTQGHAGRAEERVHIVSENGAPARRTVLSRTVLTKPLPEQRVRGTHIVIGKTLEGLASWYRYRNGAFAASTMFPRGTFLRVTNLDNGRTIIVQVNDYGPTAPDRIIDLDAVAFRKLHALATGIIRVRVEEIR